MQLIHGNCLEKMKDISDGSVSCVVTDPPYGIDFHSNKQKGNTRGEGGKEIKVRESSYFSPIAGDKTLPTEWVSIVYEKLCTGGAIYIFCQWSKWSELEKSVIRAGFNVKNMIVVNKSNHGMGDIKGQYAPKHELILFASKGRHILDITTVGRGKDVFDGKVLYSGSYRHHPNEKPVGWLEPLIMRSCNVNDTVLDPFMGSGSTGIACINTKRNFIGIEKDDKYFEIAKNRINNHLTSGVADTTESSSANS